MASDALALSYAQQISESNRPLFMSEWNRRKKDKGLALGLSFLWLIGLAGIGRMYAGQIGLGLAQLFISPLTCFVWSLVDLFLIGNAVESDNAELLAELQATFPRS
jgi:TM2 domain-containing membrane protein YozV